MLCALGAGVAGIAGCSGSPAPEPAADSTPQPSGTTAEAAAASGASTPEGEPDAQTPEEQESSPETPAGGQVRLYSMEAPGSAQIGEEVDYRFTVENAGDEPAVFEPTASARWEGSEWTAHERWDPVELPPGGRHTFESAPITSEYLSTVELRIDGFGPTVSAEFTEKRLPFSKEYRDPLDREVTIEDLGIHSTYEYESGGYRRVVEPDAGEQYVFVTVDVVNRTEEPADAPPRTEFSLLDRERSYYPHRMPGDGDYEPEEIPWGARTGGRVAYTTQSTLSRDEFRVGWYASFAEGDVGVIWTPD